jgi:hypothetical protein
MRITIIMGNDDVDSGQKHLLTSRINDVILLYPVDILKLDQGPNGMYTCHQFSITQWHGKMNMSNLIVEPSDCQSAPITSLIPQSAQHFEEIRNSYHEQGCTANFPALPLVVISVDTTSHLYNTLTVRILFESVERQLRIWRNPGVSEDLLCTPPGEYIFFNTSWDARDMGLRSSSFACTVPLRIFPNVVSMFDA